MQIEKMNQKQAAEYIQWKYTPPYEFYNIPQSVCEESMLEIFDDNGIDFYSVLDECENLFGMYEYSFNEDAMTIGLGIRPEFCGMGHGRKFLEHCISFGRKRYNYTGKVRLMVVDFNSRAVHLYKSMGFSETQRIEKLSYGKPVTFIIMEL